MATSKSPAANLPPRLAEDDDDVSENEYVIDMGDEPAKQREKIQDVSKKPDTDDDSFEELPDGSVVIKDATETEPEDPEFDENLADVFDQHKVSSCGQRLLELLKLDKQAREKRDKEYADGLQRTGLGKESPGGADFKGASKAVHPMLMEACIDFSARAMKELFPAKGPVKTHIVGKHIEDKIERADRKRQFMNWQLTKQISEYRGELERLLTQLPLGGSQYSKHWFDPDLGRQRMEFIPIDDILLPYACNDFYTTPRLTHVQHLTKYEFDRRVRTKLYRDPKGRGAAAVNVIPEQTAAAEASDKIEGREEPAFNEDGLRDVYEVQVDWDFEGDDKEAREDAPSPYCIAVEDQTGYVLAIYRNWKEKDERTTKLHWIVEWPMFPWRGAYAIGLAQAMGGLPAAATGALRALLDSAHIQNFPAAVKMKAGRATGQTIDLQVTGLTDIEGPAGFDDIRKIMMPLPFQGPSTVLFELMKFCVETGKGLISTADDQISESNQNAPVGTTLALIEQGSVTFSAVHSRLHESQRRALEITHRLDAEYLSDKETVEELGELVVSRADFEGPMDILPVSDPNIFSDSQRYAQQQAVLQLKGMFPNAFKDNVLVERTLKLLNYPDYEEVLAIPIEAKENDPVKENVCARDPLKLLKVRYGDDDFTHLQVHLSFLSSPLFCANPMMAHPAMQVLITHCTEHISAMYEKNARAAIKAAEVVGLAQESQDETSMYSGLQLAEQTLARQLAPIMDHLTKAAEMAKQFAPPPPVDPSAQAAVAVANIREQGAAQREQVKQQGETTRDKMQGMIEQQNLQMQLNADAQQAQAQRQFDALQAQLERAVNAHNVEIAEASERQNQAIQKMIADEREKAATERAAMQAHFAALLEQQRADSTAALEQQRADSTRALEQQRGDNQLAAIRLTDELSPMGTGDKGDAPAKPANK